MIDTPPSSASISRLHRLRWTISSIAVFALTCAITVPLIYPMKTLVLSGANDFLSYYAGGRLAFDDDLYNPARVQQLQKDVTGAVSSDLPFIRLPVIAALFWPLSQIPYIPAYFIWQLSCLAAVVVFAATWPAASRKYVWLALAGSLPLQWSFANAQDLPWLLAAIGVALQLFRLGRFFEAGLGLTLCLSKYHLIALVPIVLLSKSRRQTAAGFLFGTFAVVVASFLVAGANWPLAYVRLLKTARLDSELVPPNLSGLFAQWEFSQLLIGLTVASMCGLLLLASKNTGAELSIAIAILCGVLVAPHIFVQDFVLLIPVCLTALAWSQSDLVRLPALWLLTPFPYLFEIALPFPAGQIITASALVLLTGLILEHVWWRTAATRTIQCDS